MSIYQLPDELAKKLIEEIEYESTYIQKVIKPIVVAYASSANSKADEIPSLFASLYILFKKGELIIPTKK